MVITLFWLFFKIGLFSFGGGYAMLPLIYQEIQTLGLMPVQEFSDLVALSQMTPGPIAVNAATYIGYQTDLLWGATSATIGVTLPSFIIILIVDTVFVKFKNSRLIKHLIAGIRPATVGMIAAAVIFFAETSIFTGKISLRLLAEPLKSLNFAALAIFLLTLVGAKWFKIGPITLTILAGLAGALIL